MRFRDDTARDESGFTLIELMVAVAVLAVGILGLVGSVESSRSLNTVAENLTVMSHVAQRHVESLHDTPYQAIALTAAPTPSGSSSDPDFYVCTGGNYNWDRTGCATGATEPLVVVGGTDVSATIPGLPTARNWFDARTNSRGQIRTYISWVNDPQCNTSSCSTPRDYKRLSVVVTLSNGRPRTPVVVVSFAYNDSSGRICSDTELRNGASRPLGDKCG